jgi:hypothetical protein
VLQPLLVLDEGEAGAGLRALALRHVELLDLLERVRLLRDPHALADDPEEVHEDAAAQQLVHLVLARGVAAHQPLDGPGLVGGVVVDVHPGWVSRRAITVSTRLEGPLLRVRSWAQGGDGRAVLLDDRSDQELEAALEGPRVGLEVEEEVPRRGLGEGGEALARLLGVGADELVADHAVDVLLLLQARLLAQLRKGPGSDLRLSLAGREGGERGQGRH